MVKVALELFRKMKIFVELWRPLVHERWDLNIIKLYQITLFSLKNFLLTQFWYHNVKQSFALVSQHKLQMHKSSTIQQVVY